MILALLYILGSGIGGLLAIGTCWTAIQSKVQRSLALSLSEPLPQNASNAVVLASHHAGKEKASWIYRILSRKKSLVASPCTVLDIAGGTHTDLFHALLDGESTRVSVHVFDSQFAINYLLKTPEFLPLVDSHLLTLIPGQGLDQLNSSLLGQPAITFDFVLALEILHSVPPSKRLATMKQWVNLVHPEGGHLLLLFEVYPLSPVSEAGVLQGVYFRVDLGQARVLMESCGLTQCESFTFENKVALVGRRNVHSIDQH